MINFKKTRDKQVFLCFLYKKFIWNRVEWKYDKMFSVRGVLLKLALYPEKCKN